MPSFNLITWRLSFRYTRCSAPSLTYWLKSMLFSQRLFVRMNSISLSYSCFLKSFWSLIASLVPWPFPRWREIDWIVLPNLTEFFPERTFCNSSRSSWTFIHKGRASIYNLQIARCCAIHLSDTESAGDCWGVVGVDGEARIFDAAGCCAFSSLLA